MKSNAVKEKSKGFAIQVIRAFQYLQSEKKEFVLSKQVLRSATSIGANIVEADCAISKREFLMKMNISLKEAAETEYWLELLHETSYLEDKKYDSLQTECGELKAMLMAICKTTAQSLPHK